MGADLATQVWDGVTKSIAEKVVSVLSGALAAATAHAHLPGKGDKEEGGASDAERDAVYSEFLTAATRYRVSLGVLGTGPPTLVGALWTYPVHLRLLNASPRDGAVALHALLAVETKGRPAAIAAAEAVMLAVSTTARAFTVPRRTSRADRTAGIQTELEHLDEALATFTKTVRTDLGYDKPRARKS